MAAVAKSAAKSVKSSQRYLDELKRRAKESHVYKKYQLIGLEIAKTLRDEKHKTLYIKLAKELDSGELLRIAKETAERRDIKNPGAYFMAVVNGSGKNNNSNGRNDTFGGKTRCAGASASTAKSGYKNDYTDRTANRNAYADRFRIPARDNDAQQ